MAGRAIGADLRDDREHDVLGADARRGLAVHRNAHAFGAALPDRLRHQHMRHFRGADTESKRAERAMRRSVAVAADNQQAGQGEALLGPDHVHNTLPPIVQAKQLDPMLGGVFIHLAHHARNLGIADLCRAALASARNDPPRRM